MSRTKACFDGKTRVKKSLIPRRGAQVAFVHRLPHSQKKTCVLAPKRFLPARDASLREAILDLSQAGDISREGFQKVKYLF